MKEHIGDECIYLRILQLKNGSIQFTDSTNAARLIKEHGRDIRYNKAWKKWVVWNGVFWETDDSGALVQEKGLETVRNIYDEILKTDDHRERIEIEKYAMLSESVRRRKAFVEAAQWDSTLNITSDSLDPNPWLLNVKNGTIDVLTSEFTPGADRNREIRHAERERQAAESVCRGGAMGQRAQHNQRQP